MRTNDSKHIFHFALLLVILSIFFFLILAFQFERGYQVVLTVLMSSSYVVWGLIHHFKNKDLHPRIILEYLLIAVFGATILLSLLLRL